MNKYEVQGVIGEGCSFRLRLTLAQAHMASSSSVATRCIANFWVSIGLHTFPDRQGGIDMLTVQETGQMVAIKKFKEADGDTH